MLTQRNSIGDRGSRLSPIARGRKCLAALAVLALACLALEDVAYARKERKGDRDAAAQPPAAAPATFALPSTLTKTLALDGVIEALAMNRSAAAEKTLEQIVTGEFSLRVHA